MLQRLTVEQLHDDEMLLLVIANVVNRADVRVVECRLRSGFSLKALNGDRIVRKIRR
jgi:hypothetical protein